MAKVKSRKEAREYINATKNIDELINERNEAYTRGSFQYLRFSVHLIAAAQFLYGLYYWCIHVQLPKPDEISDEEFQLLLKQDFGGKLKYLTFLDLILQGLYHSIALLNDCFGSNSVQAANTLPWLRKVRDWLFASLAFPTAFNVCLSFWGVYAIDRELVFPEKLDAFFPNALNHVVHTNIAMLAVLDMFTCCRQYPKNGNGYFTTLCAMICYVVWLTVCRFANGRWAYGIFNVANAALSSILLGGMIALSVALYFVGEFVNDKIWAPELELLQRKKKLSLKTD